MKLHGMKVFQKVTDYKEELNSSGEKMISYADKYVTVQIVLDVIVILCLLFIRKPIQITFMSVPLSWWLFVFTYSRMQIILSMYLKDMNKDIYSNHETMFNSIRGYYPLAAVNVSRLSNEDLSKVKDERIYRMVNSMRRAKKTLKISLVILLSFIILKSFQLI
jgi:hypothetical protein